MWNRKMRDVRIPPLGMSTVEVDVVECRVAPGAQVQKGSVLVVIESEKAVVEIPTEHDGTVVEVLVKPGDTAKVGDVICRLQERALS